MEKFETKTGEEGQIITGELSTLFRVLSNPDTLKILYRAGMGIENSTYAIEELDLTPKRYYSRLKALVDTGLVRKIDDVYRQTALGRIIYERFLPTMGKAVDAREELELIVYLEETEIDTEVIKRIEDELNLPSFAESNKLRIIDNYESMVVDVIDLCDEAKESILMATNHIDVRILDATLRSMDRGVKNRFVVGRELLSSKLLQLRMILSPKFTKALMKLASNSTDMNEIARISVLPYSFCVVDGHINIIELSNAPAVSFIAAFHVKNRGLGEKLTDLFETLWKAGEVHSTLKILSSFKA